MDILFILNLFGRARYRKEWLVNFMKILHREVTTAGMNRMNEGESWWF